MVGRRIGLQTPRGNRPVTSWDQLGDSKQQLLWLLKDRGPLPLAVLARRLKATRENARLHLAAMAEKGWIQSQSAPSRRPGRPTHLYRLTTSGEHLFPKAYDALTVELLDRVENMLGREGLTQLLTGMTEDRLKQWRPKLKGKSFEERLNLLKEIYAEKDPFVLVETKDGILRLVETNCPFMNVAARRPMLCSVTVSVLSQLLGCRVEREQSFQAGHGRCVFRPRPEAPLPAGGPVFSFEPS